MIERRIFHVLNAAMGTIGRDTSPGDGLRGVLQSIRGMCDVEHGFVATLTDDGKHLRVAVADGLFEALDGSLHERGSGMIGGAWKGAVPVAIDDYPSWTGRGIDLVARGAQAVVLVPVLVGETVVAVLGVADDVPGRPFHGDELEALGAAARVIALVLETEAGASRMRSVRIERESIEDVEGRLRAREHRVLDAVPVGIWVKDRDNRVLRANEAAARSIGLPRSTVEDRYLWEIDPANAAQAYRRDLEVFDRGHDARDELVERIDADGGRRWWRVDRAVLRDDDGRPEKLVVVTRDVTEEHVDQDRVVASRRAELRARRVRDHAVANIAQNVRGPLRRVREALIDASEESAVLRDLETATQWIDDLIDFERVEAGNLPVECIPMDVGTLAEDVAALVAPAARANGNELSVHVDPTLPPRLGGDPVRVRQILVQLLAQANRSTRGGEILLSARTVMSSAERGEIRFEVHVSAWTLEDREVEARFGPYLHGIDALGTDTEPGAVGLALAHRLVEVLGGAVGAEAHHHDGGVGLWCALPFERSRVNESDPASVVPRSGSRILLMIPRATTAVVLERQLVDLGITIDRAHDLDDAREQVDRAAEDGWVFDAVLVDAHVDEVERWAADRAPDIRRRITALVPVGTDRGLVTFGGDRPFLAKPVRRSALLELVIDRVGLETGTESRDKSPRGPWVGEPRVLLVHDESCERTLLGATLRELGCVVVETDGASLQGEPLVGNFDLALAFDGAERTGQSPVVETIRRHDGSRGHTPVVLLAPSMGAIERDVGLAAGADVAREAPRDPPGWRALIDRWVRTSPEPVRN